MIKRTGWLIVLLCLLLPLGTAVSQDGNEAPGHVVYRLPEGGFYRIEAQPEAEPKHISAVLHDDTGDIIGTSPDGEWLIITTEQGDPDCAGWACIAVTSGDLSTVEVVHSDSGVLHPEGFIAISNEGNLVIYPGNDGPHAFDLFAARRTDAGWSSPIVLTAASPYEWNDMPAISEDGSRVLFDCGNTPYGQEGTAICEVNTDGTDLRVVFRPEDGPEGTTTHALHHADYAPDGSIVFEADWLGVEGIWRLPVETETPVRVGPDFGNDNSPCVLPDGRIVSLWLGREGGEGYHELKVMSADGEDYFMLVVDVDVLDAGIACSE